MDKKDLITARQLADLLAQYGNLPIKLRTFEAGDDAPCCVTLIGRGSIGIEKKNGQATALGDLDLVRIDVLADDNA